MSALGKAKRRFWTCAEIAILRGAYTDPNSVQVPKLVAKLQRTYAAIVCKADALGLTCDRGKYHRTAKTRERYSAAQKHIVATRPDIMAARAANVRASHARNGHPRGMLGKHQPQSARDAISRGNKGRVRPEEETKKAIATKLERYGSLVPKVSRGNWRASWRTIGTVRKFFRSSWEANYARYLEMLRQRGEIISWEHEPAAFKFAVEGTKCTSYLPDFRITHLGGSVEFHEVKGWKDADSMLKLERMVIYHPLVFVKVIDKAWFSANARDLKNQIPDWE